MSSPEAQLGPAMLAIKEEWREFVCIILTQADMNYTRAYMQVFPNASHATGMANGCALAHDERILAAMHEEADKRLRAGALLSVSVMTQIANDPTHKDRLKAAFGIADRVGFHAKTEHKVTVEKPTDDIEIIQRIVDLGKSLGLSDDTIKGMIGNNVAVPLGLLAPAAPVVDVEFEPVGTTEGLEDIL